jgi:predicted transcriptional regulator
VPDAEFDVLTTLQRLGHATAAELRRELEPVRPMAHGSVLTLLQRLEERGLVTRRKGAVGKAFVYKATQDPHATARPVLKRLLQRAFGGDTLALVASLFESRPPTAEELVELERLVADLKRRKGGHA